MAERDNPQLREAVRQLSIASNAYWADLSDKGRYDTVVRAFNKMVELAGWEAPEKEGEEELLSISDFFESVGEGMVTAQSDLDTRAEQALRDLKPHATPSVYHIPKVTAEIQFALRSTKSRKFGILLFSDKKEEEAQRQQKISFDIVAAPPPPDVLAAADQLDLGDVLVTDPKQRDWIRTQLLDCASRAGAEGTRGESLAVEKIQLFTGEATFRRVLIFRSSSGWVCVLPAEEGPNIDALQLLGTGHVESKTQRTAIPSRLHVFAQALVELSNRQAEKLEALTQVGRR